MECTGERYLPEIDGDWTLEHRHRYLVACEFAAHKTVLDIASGDGYGTYMLANVAQHAVGIDISLSVTQNASIKYPHPRLNFLQGSATAIPLADASVDLITSFETIEHLAEHYEMLTEIKRVLRSNGLLIISSPDKYEYSDRTGYHNQYHVKELYRDEFHNLIKENFKYSTTLGQRIIFGSVMGLESGKGCFFSWRKDEVNPRTQGLIDAEYIIAFASDIRIPPLPSSILKGSIDGSDYARSLAEKLGNTSDELQYLIQWEKEARLYIQVLEQKKGELENRANSLEKEIQYLEEGKKYLEASVSELEDTLFGVKAAMVSAEKEVAKVYASRSWRLTAPLRYMASHVRNIYNNTHQKLHPQNDPIGSLSSPQIAYSWPPDVRALEQTLSLSKDAPTAIPSLGIFFHIYYTELANEMLHLLRNIPDMAQIYISTDTEDKKQQIYKFVQEHALEQRTEIRVCPNKGWDIAPFLVGFADKILQHALILHIHSKRSRNIPRSIGNQWRTMLFSSLLGNTERVYAILRAFEDFPTLGMIAPPITEYYAGDLNFGKNFSLMQYLLGRYEIHITPDTQIDFPMGSMFWCRSDVLRPWLERHFTYADFAPLSDNERDCSLAHALERLFFFGCGITGFSWARLQA